MFTPGAPVAALPATRVLGLIASLHGLPLAGAVGRDGADEPFLERGGSDELVERGVDPPTRSLCLRAANHVSRSP